MMCDVRGVTRIINDKRYQLDFDLFFFFFFYLFRVFRLFFRTVVTNRIEGRVDRGTRKRILRQTYCI